MLVSLYLYHSFFNPELFFWWNMAERHSGTSPEDSVGDTGSKARCHAEVIIWQSRRCSSTLAGAAEARFGAPAPVKSLSLCSRGVEQIDHVSSWRLLAFFFFGAVSLLEMGLLKLSGSAFYFGKMQDISICFFFFSNSIKMSCLAP